VIVHIGYHKTATTWLQQHVFGNPRTGLQTVGKLGDDHPVRQLVRARPLEFDATVSRGQFEPLLRAVLDAGLVPVVSDERLCGHPISGGHDSKEIANRLKEIFPKAKVLVVIREQRSIIVSTYKQYVMSGGASSLAEFLEHPVSDSMRLPGFDPRHFEYEHLLRYYRGLYGPDGVLVLAFEQFVRDPASFVSAIGRFAGRPFDDDVVRDLPFDDVRRPSKTAFAISVRRRRNRLRRSELNPSPPLNSSVLKKLTRIAERLATKPYVPERLLSRADDALRQGVEEFVGDRYRESNRATEELAGIDLGGYGWTV
jgi:Sulfotransferase family